MSRIPPAYEAFAAGHFRALHSERGTIWPDACPAYALAYLTHTAYGPVLDPANAWELELQWDELRGASRLGWPEALTVIRAGWNFLASNSTLSD